MNSFTGTTSSFSGTACGSVARVAMIRHAIFPLPGIRAWVRGPRNTTRNCSGHQSSAGVPTSFTAMPTVSATTARAWGRALGCRPVDDVPAGVADAGQRVVLGAHGAITRLPELWVATRAVGSPATPPGARKSRVLQMERQEREVRDGREELTDHRSTTARSVRLTSGTDRPAPAGPGGRPIRAPHMRGSRRAAVHGCRRRAGRTPAAAQRTGGEGEHRSDDAPSAPGTHQELRHSLRAAVDGRRGCHPQHLPLGTLLGHAQDREVGPLPGGGLAARTYPPLDHTHRRGAEAAVSVEDKHWTSSHASIVPEVGGPIVSSPNGGDARRRSTSRARSPTRPPGARIKAPAGEPDDRAIGRARCRGTSSRGPRGEPRRSGQDECRDGGASARGPVSGRRRRRSSAARWRRPRAQRASASACPCRWR